MKKIIMLVLCLILLTGCTTKFSNTPTKKVESFFSKYQSLDEDVISQLKDITDTSVFTESQKEKYMNIMKRHYQTLKYNIKDEMIDGDIAIVTAEIEVSDYSLSLKEASNYLNNNPEEFNDENGNYDETLYNDYRLNLLEKTDNKVTWTIDIYLSKINNEWKIDNLDQDTLNKIQGIYQY